MTLYSLAVPAAIPADAVELLRTLVTTAGTSERTLENWVRTFPQVIGSSPESLYPHLRFRLPGEPEKLWEPDILYRDAGSDHYDLIELKRADCDIVVPGRDGTVWVPSSPPRFSSYAAKAISQMQIYIAHANEHREFLEKTHSLQLLFPRGLIIAGQETDLTTSKNLRLLRHCLPNGIHVLTWTTVLRRAEQLKAYKVVIGVPCIAPDEDPERAFQCGFHKSVIAGFHPWTGFSSPYADPLHIWKQLLDEAHQEIKEYASENDTDGDDETWDAYRRFQGQVLEPIYYRLGKYCLNDRQLEELSQVLPGLGSYVNTRSFETFLRRLNVGYEDTLAFLKIGSEAKSVVELKSRIDSVLIERQSNKIDNRYVEPESFYRRVVTYGFLNAKLLASDLSEVLRLGGWTNC